MALEVNKLVHKWRGVNVVYTHTGTESDSKPKKVCTATMAKAMQSMLKVSRTLDGIEGRGLIEFEGLMPFFWLVFLCLATAEVLLLNIVQSVPISAWVGVDPHCLDLIWYADVIL